MRPRRPTQCVAIIFALASGTVPAIAQTTGTGQGNARRSRDFAHLGIVTEPIRPDDDKSGLRVIYLFPGGAAETIGLQVDDEIIALNDILILNVMDFVRELRREKVGATIRMLVRRKGEKIKLKGKIGSFRKTMSHVQDTVRKRLYGKPLPALPPVKWWDPKTRAWTEKKDGLSHLVGNLSVVFSFDDCPDCTSKRYQKFVLLMSQFQKTQPDLPLAIAGIYTSGAQDEKGQDVTLNHARTLFEKSPPAFPVGVAPYPAGRVEPAVREEQLYLQYHGLIILDPQSKVRYVQIRGVPELEFSQAFAKLMQELSAKPKGASPKTKSN